MQLLHIIGHQNNKSATVDLGSSKDILARRNTLKRNRINYKFVSIFQRNDNLCLKTISEKDILKDVTHILFEHNRYPKSQKWLKKNYPHIKILLRAHNAECFHEFHKLIAEQMLVAGTSILKRLKLIFIRSLKIIKIFYLDFFSANRCDYLLSCTDYEIDLYWKRICFKSRCISVNTFSDIRVDKTIKKEIKKKYNLTMVGGILPSLFNDISYKNYLSFILNCPYIIKEKFNFYYTGYYNLPESLKLTNIERFPENYSIKKIYKKTDIIIICTNLGLGIKTKILDGFATGTNVIVPHKIAKNLPKIFRKNCLIYDNIEQNKKGSLIKLLKKFEPIDPQILINAHAEYKRQSEKNLISIFNSGLEK